MYKVTAKIRNANMILAQPTIEQYLIICYFRCYIFFSKMIPVFEIKLCCKVRKRAEVT